MLETKVIINWIFITSCGSSASQSRTKSLSFPRQFLPLDFVAWINNKLKKATTKLENCDFEISPDNLLQLTSDQLLEPGSLGQTSCDTCHTGPQTLGLRTDYMWKIPDVSIRQKHSTKRSLHVSVQFSYTGSWDPASKVKPVNVLSHNELHLKMKMTDEICLLYINWWWVFCDVNLFRCAYATIKNCKLIFEA